MRNSSTGSWKSIPSERIMRKAALRFNFLFKPATVLFGLPFLLFPGALGFANIFWSESFLQINDHQNVRLNYRDQ